MTTTNPQKIILQLKRKRLSLRNLKRLISTCLTLEKVSAKTNNSPKPADQLSPGKPNLHAKHGRGL